MAFPTTPQFVPLSGIISQTMKENNNKNMDIEPTEVSSDSESSDEYFPEGENRKKLLLNSRFGKGITFITPFYCNGYRWTEGSKIKISRKFYKNEFTVISWNVWFGPKDRETRMNELGKVICQYNPDIVALQEVTPQLIKMIVKHKWAHEYFISDYEGSYIENYGNIILSKVNFYELGTSKLKSRMSRRALLGSFLVHNFDQLAFGTWHLESNIGDKDYRALQLKTYKAVSKNFSQCVLVGDTNFISDNEGDVLAPHFKDAWVELYQKTPGEASINLGYTFDTDKNLMAKEEYVALNLEPKRQRLDRCYYTHETIEPLWMKIVGDTPYGNNNKDFISDHFGIVIRLRLKKYS